MSWSKRDVVVLLQLVRRRPAFYSKTDEYYHSELMKNIAQDMASSLSSLRPGTTATDVLKKWEELYSEFGFYHKRKSMKQKLPPRPNYFEEMSFLLPHIDPRLQSTLSEINVNIENLNNTKKELIKKGRSSKHDMEATEETHLPRNRSSILCKSNEPEDVDMDNSSITPELLSHKTSGPKGKKRRASEVSATNTSIHVSSGTPLRSFDHANRTLLDRTKANAPEFDVSINTPDPLSSIDEQDEDVLYTKYIACRLKKLDANKKLKFKVEIERFLNGVE